MKATTGHGARGGFRRAALTVLAAALAACLALTAASCSSGSDDDDDSSTGGGGGGGGGAATVCEMTGEKSTSTVNFEKITESNVTIEAMNTDWSGGEYKVEFKAATDITDLEITVSVTGKIEKEIEHGADGLKVYFYDSDGDASEECITLGWFGTSDTPLTGSDMNPAAADGSFDITKTAGLVIKNYMFSGHSDDWVTISGAVSATISSLTVEGKAAEIGKLVTLPAQSGAAYTPTTETLALSTPVKNTMAFKITVKGTGTTEEALRKQADNYTGDMGGGLQMTFSDGTTESSEYILGYVAEDADSIEYTVNFLKTVEVKDDSGNVGTKAGDYYNMTGDTITGVTFKNYSCVPSQNWNSCQASAPFLIDSFKIEAVEWTEETAE